MLLSAFDLFTIGIGPSSSHTVGPMRAAKRFAEGLTGLPVARVVVTLYGSLALTGRGHGTDKAVLLGLEGATPEEIEIEKIPSRLTALREGQHLTLACGAEVPFTEKRDLVFAMTETLPGHPNGMRFEAFNAAGISLRQEAFYSNRRRFHRARGRPAARGPQARAVRLFQRGGIARALLGSGLARQRSHAGQ